MDRFISAAKSGASKQDWYQRNLRAFLKVVKMHGETAKQHHNSLVENFIVSPVSKMKDGRVKTNVTASGPPLEVMLSGLAKLRDARSCAERTDIATRYLDVKYLRGTLN